MVLFGLVSPMSFCEERHHEYQYDVRRAHECGERYCKVCNIIRHKEHRSFVPVHRFRRFSKPACSTELTLHPARRVAPHCQPVCVWGGGGGGDWQSHQHGLFWHWNPASNGRTYMYSYTGDCSDHVGGRGARVWRRRVHRAFFRNNCWCTPKGKVLPQWWHTMGVGLTFNSYCARCWSKADNQTSWWTAQRSYRCNGAVCGLWTVSSWPRWASFPRCLGCAWTTARRCWPRVFSALVSHVREHGKRLHGTHAPQGDLRPRRYVRWEASLMPGTKLKWTRNASFAYAKRWWLTVRLTWRFYAKASWRFAVNFTCMCLSKPSPTCRPTDMHLRTTSPAWPWNGCCGSMRSRNGTIRFSTCGMEANTCRGMRGWALWMGTTPPRARVSNSKAAIGTAASRVVETQIGRRGWIPWKNCIGSPLSRKKRWGGKIIVWWWCGNASGGGRKRRIPRWRCGVTITIWWSPWIPEKHFMADGRDVPSCGCAWCPGVWIAWIIWISSLCTPPATSIVDETKSLPSLKTTRMSSHRWPV